MTTIYGAGWRTTWILTAQGRTPRWKPKEKGPEVPVINLEEEMGVKQAEEIIHLQKHIELL